MATELIFQAKFIKPLVECYGPTKLPAIRIKKIWEKLKSFPDSIIDQCAEKIILNFDTWPGVQAVLNTCGQIGGEYAKHQAEQIKAENNCFRCRSQGVIQANNFAYKCTCQLGELLYPAYPLYEGEIHIEPKIFKDAEGNHVYEDANFFTIVPRNNRDVRQIKTIVKGKNLVRPKAKTQGMRTLSFDEFPV